ncbi:DoxX-like family protein [Niabella ginsengisoli]|uniref:DoxX-like family protein n=2 Tax=Niabella ginsengisoli TaxID=522298 RepID=A0ABS9SJB6_9BACT|nr:DoxX-like family protein [Niabella ginsengisoli]
MVPRHRDIVASIFGDEYARQITFLIGFAEIGMAIWIISNFRNKLNAIAQIVIIGTMNLLEFFLVPNLLLWGRWNFLFAFLLMSIIFYNRFFLFKTKVTNV